MRRLESGDFTDMRLNRLGRTGYALAMVLPLASLLTGCTTDMVVTIQGKFGNPDYFFQTSGTRPTMLLLAGLTGDYVHDGRVLVEELSDSALPKSMRGINEVAFLALSIDGAPFFFSRRAIDRACRLPNAPAGDAGRRGELRRRSLRRYPVAQLEQP